MNTGIVYELINGRIVGHSSGDRVIENLLPQLGFYETDSAIDGASTYILNGQPTERPASPVTIDGRTLSNVPAGSALWIDGEQYEAEGEVELDFVMPGTYKLRVVCFPYLNWEYELVML